MADSPIDRCPNFVSTDHTGNTIVPLAGPIWMTPTAPISWPTLTDPITEVLDHLGRLSTVNDAADVRLLEERLIVLREQLRVLEKEQAGFCEKLDHVCGLDSYFDNIHEIKSGFVEKSWKCEKMGTGWIIFQQDLDQTVAEWRRETQILQTELSSETEKRNGLAEKLTRIKRSLGALCRRDQWNKEQTREERHLALEVSETVCKLKRFFDDKDDDLTDAHTELDKVITLLHCEWLYAVAVRLRSAVLIFNLMAP